MVYEVVPPSVYGAHGFPEEQLDTPIPARNELIAESLTQLDGLLPHSDGTSSNHPGIIDQ